MMKRLLLLLAAVMLALPVFTALPRPASAADAQMAPAHEQRVRGGRHYGGYRHYGGPRYGGRGYVRRYGGPGPRVYSYGYRYPSVHYSYGYGYYYHPPIVYAPPVVVAPPPPVVYQPTPVVVEAPPQPEAQVYAEPEPAPAQPEQDLGASFTIRLLGQNQSDAALTYETIKGAQLWGLGGALRFALDPHWGAEFAADFLTAKVNGASQLSVPLSLSAMARLFPDSVIDPYGVAGLGVIFNEYDDPNYTTTEQYTQFEGHLGAGAELNLGSWLITADLRVLFMQARPERGGVVPQDSSGGTGGTGVTVRGSSGGSTQTASTSAVVNNNPDSLQTGLQFMVGAGWRF